MKSLYLIAITALCIATGCKRSSNSAFIITPDNHFNTWTTFDNGSMTGYPGSITAMAFNAVNDVFVYNANNHIYQLKNGVWDTVGFSAIMPRGAGNLVNDNKGNIYTAPTDGAYIIKWDGKQWTRIDFDHPDIYSIIKWQTAMAADRLGNIYVVAEVLPNTQNQHFTILRWSGNGWQDIGYPRSNYYYPGSVHAITTDLQGNLYTTVGPSSGLHKWDGSKWTIIEFPPDMDPNHQVYMVSASDDKHIYVAGNTDYSHSKYFVGRWDGSQWQILATPDRAINAITTDDAGHVYIAGYLWDENYKFYVAKWDGNAWINFGKLTAPDYLSCLATDAANNIYAGGRSVSKYNK